MAKRKRRSSTRAVAHRPATRKSSPRRRRRRTGGLSGGMASSFKATLNAGVGGALYGVGTNAMGLSPVSKGVTGLVAAFALGFFNLPMMGAGVAGAATSDLARSITGMADSDDLEDAEFTDVDLADDEFMDDDGNVYALNDDGSTEYLGNAYDLSDDFALSEASGEQSVLMVPTYAQY